MQDTKISLNKWEVISTSTLLIPKGEEARFEILPEDPFIITIRLETKDQLEGDANKGEARKRSISIGGKDNECVISLINWDNVLGTATAEPMEVAHDDKGYAIAVMCSATQIGIVSQLFLQVMRRKLS